MLSGRLVQLLVDVFLVIDLVVELLRQRPDHRLLLLDLFLQICHLLLLEVQVFL